MVKELLLFSRIKLAYIFLAIFIIFFLLMHSPNSVDYDALSYINFYGARPPLYPMFIWIFHWAGNYQFKFVVWTHAIITFSSLLYARRWLKTRLKINDFLIFIVFCIVTVTILFHFQLMLIGAEGLTFPFFIWIFFLLIECFNKFDLKKILYLSIWVSVIILTRLQFYYFYGIYIVLILWYFLKGVPIKKVGSAVIIFLALALLTGIIGRSYQYIKFGVYSTEPATGKLLIVQALYLTKSDSPLPDFRTKNERQYAENMLSMIYENKLNKEASLLLSTKPSYYELAYEEYNKNYIAINDIVSKVLSNLTPYQFNEITQDISKTLFFNNPKENFLFILWKFIVFIGGIPLFLFFLIIVSACIPAMFFCKKNKFCYVHFFVLVSILVIFLNAATVSLFEAYTSPYFCYSQFLLYCLSALFSDRLFFNKET